jgi:hypothetical protein
MVFRARLLRFQILKLPFRGQERERHQVNDERHFGNHGSAESSL